MLTKEEKEYVSKTISLLLRPEASKIVLAMLEKEEVTEEWLCKISNMKLSVVRKILYDLFELGFVDFKKERNDKTSWYIYHAIFKWESFNTIVINRLKIIQNKLKYRLKYEEENQFYECPIHKKRKPLNEAIQNNFLCTEENCNKVLIEFDNSLIIKKLKDKIKKVEKVIKEIEKEQ